MLPFPRFLSTLQICRLKIVFSFNVTSKYHLPQPANIVSSEWSVQSNSLSHFQFLGIQSPLLQANWFDGHLGVGVTNGFPRKSSYDINFSPWYSKSTVCHTAKTNTMEIFLTGCNSSSSFNSLQTGHITVTTRWNGHFEIIIIVVVIIRDLKIQRRDGNENVA